VEFSLTATDGLARRGAIEFERGVVQTPAFMPVGTYGTVKGMTPEDVVLRVRTFCWVIHSTSGCVRVPTSLACMVICMISWAGKDPF
jgi:hypothetical protein